MRSLEPPFRESLSRSVGEAPRATVPPHFSPFRVDSPRDNPAPSGIASAKTSRGLLMITTPAVPPAPSVLGTAILQILGVYLGTVTLASP